jgi:hypothetical protein
VYGPQAAWAYGGAAATPAAARMHQPWTSTGRRQRRDRDPTFFSNGQRHYGAYDIDSRTAAITTARAQLLTPAERPRATAE